MKILAVNVNLCGRNILVVDRNVETTYSVVSFIETMASEYVDQRRLGHPPDEAFITYLNAKGFLEVRKKDDIKRLFPKGFSKVRKEDDINQLLYSTNPKVIEYFNDLTQSHADVKINKKGEFIVEGHDFYAINDFADLKSYLRNCDSKISVGRLRKKIMPWQPQLLVDTNNNYLEYYNMFEEAEFILDNKTKLAYSDL